ncbi:MAG: hypothetical protein GY807_12820 [Gammaproteobacteria bacterium]|nr:hypothetical protein [Gammaproteobacteria bacterium]
MHAVVSKAGQRSAPNTTSSLKPIANTSSTPKFTTENLHTPLSTHMGVFALYFLVAAVAFQGWQYRDEAYLTAESGLGYAFGIVGGSLMILLFLYPLRKKARFMRRWGPVRHWFRVHKVFGILGPLMVLFHANYSIGSGSLNSQVALYAMLLVAGSGLIGRYIYTKIHHGLYGHRATLKELLLESEVKKRNLEAVFAFAPKSRVGLEALEAKALSQKRGVLHSVVCILNTGIMAHSLRHTLLCDLRHALKTRAQDLSLSKADQLMYKKAASHFIRDYLTAVRRATVFAVYERLFALWHTLHLPLFFMLLIAGIVHVVAVHMY